MPAKLNRRSLQKCKKAQSDSHLSLSFLIHHRSIIHHPSFTPQSMVNIAHSLIWMSCPSPNRKPSLQVAVLVISQDCLQIISSLSPLSVSLSLSLSFPVSLSTNYTVYLILHTLQTNVPPRARSIFTTPPSSTSSPLFHHSSSSFFLPLCPEKISPEKPPD